MKQKDFEVIHVEKIENNYIKSAIIVVFNLFSKFKYYIFLLQFALINSLENYNNKINKKNNFFFRNIAKNNEKLLIVANSKEACKLKKKKNLNSDIVVVNDFFISELRDYITPNYYFFFHPFEGEHYFDDTKYKKIYIKKFRKYVIKNKKTQFFFDPSFKSIFGIKKNVHYVNFSSVPLCYFHDVNKINIEKKFPPVSNIAHACTLIGIYLNYKNIKIIGYKLDYFVGNLDGYNLNNIYTHLSKKITLLDSSYKTDDDFWMVSYIYSGWLILRDLCINKNIKFETNLPYSKLYLFKK